MPSAAPVAEVETALPMPAGDPEALEALATTLRLGAGRCAETVLARQGAGGLDLAGLWSGPAFEAARTELSTAATVLAELGSRFAPAAAALDGYADALTAARRTVATLREEWHAADRIVETTATQVLPVAADPVTGLLALPAADASRDRTRTQLLDRHASCAEVLQIAQEHAAGALLSLLGEAVSPGHQRDLLLGRLALTRSAASRTAAAMLVERALAGCDPDARNWTGAQARRVLSDVAGSATDPFVAQALLDRIGASGLEHLVRLLGPGDALPAPSPLAWTDDARRVLALAFATTVSEPPARDPLTASSLQQWQAGWTAALLERPVEGLTAQLGLLAVAARGRNPVLPGGAYAAGALRTLLRRDVPQQRRYEWRPAARGVVPVIAPATDPVSVLVSTLAADPALARRVLLAPGATGPTLVHDLVASRPFVHTDELHPVPSNEALGRLLEQLVTGPDRASSDQDRLRGAVLDALGDAGMRWWRLEGEEAMTVDRRLDPLRRPAALLLATDPARVWDAIGPLTVDRDGGAAAARTQALLGEIGKAPELAGVLATLAAFEADRLSEQLAAGNAVTSPPVRTAALRLGYVVGFTASSAAAALLCAARQHDAVSARERADARDVAEIVDLLPIKYAGPVGAVATALQGPAELVVKRIVANANPVDHAERAAASAEAVIVTSRQLATASAVKAGALRLSEDEPALVLVSLDAAASVGNGAAAVSPSGPVPRRAP